MKLYLILDAALKKNCLLFQKPRPTLRLNKKKRRNATKVPPRQIFVQQGIHLRWGRMKNHECDIQQQKQRGFTLPPIIMVQ